MNSAAPKAVFLSYASQDADVARRICDALRAAGVEVWFDQSELRGGDAWDAKIRKQIKECALFVPIISANTQARREGYFRLEWHLAEDRTRLMAKGTPFLMPVCVDDTTDRNALVPDSFLVVQWTRLPAGQAGVAFCEQVKLLLTGDVAQTSSPAVRPDAGGKRASPRRRLWPWGALAFAAMVAFADWNFRTASPPRSVPAVPGAVLTAAPKLNEKSLVVLPFENLSPDRENEFFAGGLREETLSSLYLLREIRVVSMSERNSAKSPSQIARDLGVPYALHCSVRRLGDRVRVTGHLIKAESGEQVWTNTIEKNLTDVFVIQAELARVIAAELRTALSPQEQRLLERRPTENPVAYALYLQARDLFRTAGTGPHAAPKAAALLQAAVALDGRFEVAWAQLACFQAYAFFSEPTAQRRALAKEALDQATRLAPGSPEVRKAAAAFSYYALRDFAKALGEYDALLKILPNDPEIHQMRAGLCRRLGRWADVLAAMRRGLELDPGDLFSGVNYARVLLELRRYGESAVERRRLVGLDPNHLGLRIQLALIPFYATGTTDEARKVIADFTQAEASSSTGIAARKGVALATGDLAEYRRLDAARPEIAPQYPSSTGLIFLPVTGALVEMALGDRPAAQVKLPDVEALRAQIEAQPENDRTWALMGATAALRGEKDEALRCVQKAVELVPESSDAVLGLWHRNMRAFVYAWTGHKDQAIAEYAYLLRMPCGLNVHEMRNHPALHRCRATRVSRRC